MMMDGGSTAERTRAGVDSEVPVVCAYEGGFRRLLSIGIFPFTFFVFIGVGIVAMRHGLPPAWLSPLAVPPFILWVSLLERYHPYCKAWNRDHGDLRADLVHMFVSALLTPQAVTWILTATLVPLSALLTAKFDWFLWPKDWPILVQLAIALTISEFGGYWAHRLQHEIPLLWRVHAAHHGASRLYWLNAARFHPIDMAMLAGAGFGPLILLGCPPETMAITLLFAGMHGTFQHANIHVKLGFLNWVFSMAELHRWHHSRDIQESSSNYSGHVLIWDVVFGTRFLPKDRLPPCDIGIAGMPTFPNDYIEQLKSPFTLDRLQSDQAVTSAPIRRTLPRPEAS
jgi:sterol desaturase/sphingolipid hydroxylase (fatty acid hydroxylase superfamily)